MARVSASSQSEVLAHAWTFLVVPIGDEVHRGLEDDLLSQLQKVTEPKKGLGTGA